MLRSSPERGLRFDPTGSSKHPQASASRALFVPSGVISFGSHKRPLDQDFGPIDALEMWVTKDVPLNPDHAFSLLEPVLYEQDGFTTTRQAELVGCPRSALAHLVRLGRMERVRKGVFRSSWGAPVMPRVESELYADFLLLDGGRLPWHRREAIVVVSHASAARMLRIGVLPADRHEFTSPVRRSTSQPTIELRIAPLVPRDWEWMVDGRIAVTRAERTIVDLALTGTSRDYLRRALRDARRRDLLDEDELARVIDRRIVSANRSSIVWLRDELQPGG